MLNALLHQFIQYWLKPKSDENSLLLTDQAKVSLELQTYAYTAV